MGCHCVGPSVERAGVEPHHSDPVQLAPAHRNAEGFRQRWCI